MTFTLKILVNLQNNQKIFTMKQPIQETKDDFWVKVVEREVEVVVFLNQSVNYYLYLEEY